MAAIRRTSIDAGGAEVLTGSGDGGAQVGGDSVRLLGEPMDCPVCASKATDFTPPTYDGLVIGCSRCGKYRIMRAALADLRRSRIEDRKAALGHARSFASKSWPTISKACLPEIKDRERTAPARPVQSREMR